MILAEECLKDYIHKSRPHVDSFFDSLSKKAGLVSPLAVEMVNIFHNFIGGKRLRGALTYFSYKMFGGQLETDILKASTIIEIIHSFALMHDDIMDEDDLRRGQPTIHKQYEKIFKERYHDNPKKNPAHFGLSMAIDAGDLGPFLANLIIYETDFSAQIKMEFLKILSETIVTTVYGQALDITFESETKPTLDEILKVHLYKTANYTITGPLGYGAVLAGISPKNKVFKALGDYGRPVGIAFQLRDDELGMFSSEKVLGKSVDSDLKEGKNTLLFLKAFENGNQKEVDFLRFAHGNHNLKKLDVEKVRKIVLKTGSLKHSQQESRRLVEQGKKFIGKITSDVYYVDLLGKIADYVIERKS